MCIRSGVGSPAWISHPSALHSSGRPFGRPDFAYTPDYRGGMRVGGLSTTLSLQSMVQDTYSAGPGHSGLVPGGKARKLKVI